MKTNPIISETSFIGRRKELLELKQELQEARYDGAKFIFVEGRSGLGKSRLLSELEAALGQENSLVLKGQAIDRSARRPLEDFIGVIDGLLDYGKSHPDFTAKIRDDLFNEQSTLSSIFPSLETIFGKQTKAKLGPEDFAENRGVRACAKLLSSMGTAEKPAVILLEDLQWAGDLTLKVLFQWWKTIQESEEKVYTSIVINYRPEELTDGHLFRYLEPSKKITLDSLNKDEIKTLINSAIGQAEEEVSNFVAQLSAGNPFLVYAVIRGAVESGSFVLEGNLWRLANKGNENGEAVNDAREFIERRLKLLDEKVFRLLKIAAVLGKVFNSQILKNASSCSEAESFAFLEELSIKHFVRKIDGGNYVFTHDKIRETILDLISEQEKKEIHIFTANFLERKQAFSIFELAYHFHSAGEYKKAAKHALPAAREARAHHALELAEEQYLYAVEGIEESEIDICFQVALELGEVYKLRGKCEKAIERFIQARELAKDDLAIADIECQMGEIFFKTGDLQGSIRELENGLERLGTRVPRNKFQLFSSIAKEVFIQVCHTFFPKLFVGRKPLDEKSETTLLCCRLHSRLTYPYFFGKGKFETLWTHLRGLSRAEKYLANNETAFAYAVHGPIVAMMTMYQRGVIYMDKSFKICQDLGNLWGEGNCLSLYTLVFYTSAAYNNCIGKCLKGIEILERTGDFWARNTCNEHLAFSFYRLGNLAETIDVSKKLIKDGQEINDHLAICVGLEMISKASYGQVPADLLQLLQEEVAYNEGNDIQAYVEVSQAEAVRKLSIGEIEEACKILENAWEIVCKRKLFQEYTVTALPWLLTAKRMKLEQSSGPKVLPLTIYDLRKTAKQARKFSKTFRNNLPHSLREAGLVESLAGNQTKALALLGQSLATAESFGARYEIAQTLLARGCLLKSSNLEASANDIALATEILHDIGANLEFHGLGKLSEECDSEENLLPEANLENVARN